MARSVSLQLEGKWVRAQKPSSIAVITRLLLLPPPLLWGAVFHFCCFPVASCKCLALLSIVVGLCKRSNKEAKTTSASFSVKVSFWVFSLSLASLNIAYANINRNKRLPCLSSAYVCACVSAGPEVFANHELCPVHPLAGGWLLESEKPTAFFLCVTWRVCPGGYWGGWRMEDGGKKKV